MDPQVRNTLYIDIDSTIWPAEDEYTKAEMRLFGTDDLRKHYYTATELSDKYGENFVDILKHALNPDNVMERELYPGCAEVLCDLYESGYRLYFLSHSYFARDMVEPLGKWLESVMYEGVQFDLKVMHERFHKWSYMKKDPTAYALIDDRPHNLIGAMTAGYKVLAKKHVWNEYMGIPMFDDWYNVPKLLPMKEMV